MAKHLGLIVLGALLSAGLIVVGCSSDEEDSVGDGSPDLDIGQGDGTGTVDNSGSYVSPHDPGVFTTEADADGDGAVSESDIVAAGAGQPISQETVDAFEDSSCAAWQIEPEPLAASLFFVVDASSSMRDDAVNTGGEPKWDVTRDAIIGAINTMPEGSQVGVLGYPNQQVSSGDCVNTDALFPADFLSNSRDELIAAIEAIQTQTCTPTHDAYNAAVAHFSAAATMGQKYILLMTDGQPTVTQGCSLDANDRCTSDGAGPDAMQDVIDAVSAAYAEQDVKTFMLGSPGSEEHSDTGLDNRWWLSEAAEAGGTSPGDCSHTGEPYCHFDMTVEEDFAQGLNEALGEVIGMVAQCDYSIPSAPIGQSVDTNAIHLVLAVGGTELIEIFRSPNSDCTHGWYLEGDHVRLCPASCEVVQADALMELQWLFGCGSEPLDPGVT